MATETLYATSLTSGTVATSTNALGAPDAVFTTDVDNVSWTARFAMGNPTAPTANGDHTFTARVRKETGSGTPVLNSITVYEGATSRVVRTLDQGITSTTGVDVQITLTQAEIRSVTNLADCEVEIVTTQSGGGPSARSCVQLDAITWSGDFTAALTVVGKNVGLVWDVRAAVGDPLQAIWDVSTSVGDPLALSWDVTTPVGDPVELVWNVEAGGGLTAVGKDLGTVWDTRAVVGDPMQAVWDTRTVVGDPLEAQWAVRTLAGDPLQAVWDTRALAGDTVDVQWGTRILATRNTQSVWDVHTTVGDPLEVLWNIDSALTVVGKSLALSWDVAALAVVGRDLATVWDVSTTVTKTLDNRWDTRAPAGRPLQVLWTVEGTAPSGLPTGPNRSTAAIRACGATTTIRGQAATATIRED